MTIQSNPPKVSIGLPVYNGENYLKGAIESVLSQTYKDFEFIILDNASCDSTDKICKTFAKNDSRITYIRNKENIGGINNLNKVVKLSRGKYFKWVAHDDLIAPQFLEKLVDVLDNNPNVVLAYSCTTRIDENGNQITNNYSDGLDIHFSKPHQRFKAFHERFKKNTMCDPVFGLIRLDVLKKTPLVRAYAGGDTVLMSELTLLGEFHEVSESMFFRRIHPNMFGQANLSLKEKMMWMDPGGKSRILTRRMRLLFGFIKVVNKSSMSWLERWSCYWDLLFWAFRHWKGLLFDMYLVAKQIMRKLLPSPDNNFPISTRFN